MGHTVETSPERVRGHIRRPHPDKMITDQIRSTVYLIDPTGSTGRGGVRAVRLSSAGHMWPVGAWLLVQARKITVMTLAYLLAHWPLVEIGAA